MTYYGILGVPLDADIAMIKKAYRKLARKVHPDLNRGDEGPMKMLQEAYECLKDPVKRAAYDGGEAVDDLQLEKEAIDVLEGMFAAVMDELVCPVDMVGAVRNRLRHGDQTLRVGIERQQINNKRLLRIQGRVVRKSEGPNAFEVALAEKLKALAKTERAQRIGQIAMDLLEAYVDTGRSTDDVKALDWKSGVTL